jgi:diacylglycerol O-acyltransferase
LPPLANVAISNVPGPPVPLYFVGARIEGFYPLGPIFHGAGLNVTVMSNDGRMHVGLLGDRDAMPDIQDLADNFPQELEALRAAVLD